MLIEGKAMLLSDGIEYVVIKKQQLDKRNFVLALKMSKPSEFVILELNQNNKVCPVKDTATKNMCLKAFEEIISKYLDKNN